MASLPEFVYFRLSENRSREPVRYNPDYPLVLFVLFSRWSFGIAIVAGFMYIGNRVIGLVKVGMVLALGLIFAATIFSIFHLNDRVRFMTMMKNPRSRVSHEVFLAGAFMVTVTLNGVILFLRSPVDLICIVAACGVIGFGLLALAATGWAYKFYSHPLWNTNILSVYYLISGLCLGVSTLFWLGTSFFPVSDLGTLRGMQITLAGLLLGMLLVGVAYVKYVRANSNKKHRLNLKGKNEKLVLLYALFVFILPAVFIILSAVARKFLVLSSTSIFVSLLVGSFVERVLFFSIESPHYMFRVISEESM